MRRVLLAALALAGCSDAFDPTVPDDRAFAVFGTLDGRQPRQVLRVKDISVPLDDVAASDPATVTSRTLPSGEVVVWRDSLVTLGDGGRDRVYLARLAVAAGQTVEVEAARADGARSSVTVVLPDPVAQAVRADAVPSLPVRFDVRGLLGRPSQAVVRYRVRRPGGETVQVDAPVSIDGTDAVRTVTAFVGNGAVEARRRLYGSNAVLGDPVVLLDVRVDALVESTEPAPVRDGVGGVGWVVPVSVPLPVPDSVVTQAGFTDGR